MQQLHQAAGLGAGLQRQPQNGQLQVLAGVIVVGGHADQVRFERGQPAHLVHAILNLTLVGGVLLSLATLGPDRIAGSPADGTVDRTVAAAGAQAPSFRAFVDRYLQDFARRHPSIAAGNGIHDFDGTLDDYSAAAITREIAELKRTRAELRAFPASALTADERVDQKILDGVIDGWLLEQETLQNWRRNPMLYASVLSDGVHNLMTMTNAPAPVRMRRIIGKLTGVPGLLAAARANLRNPPKLLAERGAAMMKGASGMLATDVVLAFTDQRGTPLMEEILNRGLPYCSGPQWLAENVLRDRWVLAVAGTHGKTTTSSMLAWILEDAG